MRVTMSLLLILLTGCYNPPDFGESGSFTFPSEPPLDLPVPPNVELQCAFGPANLRTDDLRYTNDLHFFLQNPAPESFMVAPEGSAEDWIPLEVPLPSPVAGYVTLGSNATNGTYAMIADDEAEDYLLVGGIDRYLIESEDWAEPGDFLGVAGGVDGFPSLLTVGMHHGSRAYPETDNLSLPSVFRVVDVTAGIEGAVATEQFVCGESGHIYRSLLGL